MKKIILDLRVGCEKRKVIMEADKRSALIEAAVFLTMELGL